MTGILYRALNDLSKGETIIPQGTVLAFPWLSETDIQRLIDVGAIAEVYTPPLEALPEFRASARLLDAGLDSIEALMAADPVALAERLGCDVSYIEAMKQEALQWLQPMGGEYGADNDSAADA